MTFALFLYNETAVAPQGYPENPLSVYQKWRTDLQGKGVDLIGEPLMEGGVVPYLKDDKLEMLAFEDWDLAMAGYFIFEAERYEAALEIASTNPHLKFGGSVVLREIDRLR